MGIHEQPSGFISACAQWSGELGVEHYRALGSYEMTYARPMEPLSHAGFDIDYYGGDLCDDQINYARTSVHAYCDPAAETPVLEFLEEESNCNYHFNLRSAAACPINSNALVQTTCAQLLFSPDRRYRYEFFKLRAPSGAYHARSILNGLEYDFYVNICPEAGFADKCAENTVCSVSSNGQRMLGDYSKATLLAREDNRGFTVTIPDGELCGDNVYASTVISVECSETHTTPQLIFVGETGHCVSQFQLLAAEGACGELVVYDSPVVGQPSRRGNAGMVVLVVMLVLIVLACFVLAGLRILRSSRPDSNIPDPMGWCENFSCTQKLFQGFSQLDEVRDASVGSSENEESFSRSQEGEELGDIGSDGSDGGRNALSVARQSASSDIEANVV